MRNHTIRRMCVLAGLFALSVITPAVVDDAKININRTKDSPTLTVKYNNANTALIELRLNGESYGTRTMSDAKATGETTFSLDLLALKDGENEIEIRLYDRSGKLIGTQKTVITTEDTVKDAISLAGVKTGETVRGPVEFTVEFGRDLKGTYVSFFVNDQFKSMKNTPPYTYMWDTSREPNGWHEIEAWVVDDTSTTYKAKKIRVFVNNPGGRTYRKTEPAVKAPEPVVKAPYVALSNPVGVTEGMPFAGLKSSIISASVEAMLAPSAIAPAVMGVLSSNLVQAGLEKQPMLVKPSVVPAGKGSSDPLAVIPQNLGKAPVAPKVEKPVVVERPVVEKPVVERPVVQKPVIERPIVEKPVVEKSVVQKPVIERPVVQKPFVQKPVVEKAIVEKRAPIVEKTTFEASAKPMMVAKQTPTKAAAVVKQTFEAAKTIPIIKGGQKLPDLHSLTVVYNSQIIDFDVEPRVVDGVPVAPFRHLIEGAGGSVLWSGGSQEVKASAEGRDIWFRIGDKTAMVNRAPIELELAPFLERGRAIVPLSFLRDALNVDVEYDKATGHVLISAAKK